MSYSIIHKEGAPVGFAYVKQEGSDPIPRIEAKRVLLDMPSIWGLKGSSGLSAPQSRDLAPLVFTVGGADDLRLLSWDVGYFKNGAYVLEHAIFGTD